MEQRTKTDTDRSNFVMERLSRVDEQDRSFDIEFWQRQDSNARFSAAWELVVFAHQRKGRDESELRLQRTVESIERSANSAKGKGVRAKGRARRKRVKGKGQREQRAKC